MANCTGGGAARFHSNRGGGGGGGGDGCDGGGGGGGRGGRGGGGDDDDADAHMSRTFMNRISRGNNLTKVGANSHPRDIGMLIAAQARACVDCPTLQVVGPQSCNQALKAMAIARTFLKESQDIDICMQARATHSARNSPPRIAQF